MRRELAGVGCLDGHARELGEGDTSIGLDLAELRARCRLVEPVVAGRIQQLGTSCKIQVGAERDSVIQPAAVFQACPCSGQPLRCQHQIVDRPAGAFLGKRQLGLHIACFRLEQGAGHFQLTAVGTAKNLRQGIDVAQIVGIAARCLDGVATNRHGEGPGKCVGVGRPDMAQRYRLVQRQQIVCIDAKRGFCGSSAARAGIVEACLVPHWAPYNGFVNLYDCLASLGPRHKVQGRLYALRPVQLCQPLVDLVDVQNIAGLCRECHPDPPLVFGSAVIQANILDGSLDDGKAERAGAQVLRCDVGACGYKPGIKEIAVQTLQCAADQVRCDAGADVAGKHGIAHHRVDQRRICQADSHQLEAGFCRFGFRDLGCRFTCVLGKFDRHRCGGSRPGLLWRGDGVEGQLLRRAGTAIQGQSRLNRYFRALKRECAGTIGCFRQRHPDRTGYGQRHGKLGFCCFCGRSCFFRRGVDWRGVNWRGVNWR